MSKEEEKEMATAPDKAKTRLEELKERAMKRKNASASNKPSEKYLEELKENADLLYSEQLKTME